jgi:alcohol dehydrogenase class IV
MCGLPSAGTPLMQGVFMRWPAQVLFGRGQLRQLGEHARRFDVRRALIVTDAGVRRAGIVDTVGAVLRRADIVHEIFDGVHPDPPIEDVIAATRVAREGGFDTVIGLGGGSAMDTAKAVSALAPAGRTLDALYGQDRVPGPGLVKILIPTTGGSGSEISDSCNFSDHSSGHVKRLLLSRHLLADLALVDPSLTDHAPASVTAESGIDAVTHALEAFTCRNASDFADVWSRKALTLAAKSLSAAVAQGAEAPQARDDMALAAMLANAAADMAGLGAVHGLTHGLTARFPISHGRSNAILLPAVMTYNLTTRPERFAEIAAIFAPDEGQGAAAAAASIARLCATIGLAGRLRDFGIAQQDFPEIAAGALSHFPRHFGANPRQVTAEDAAGIYLSVW